MKTKTVTLKGFIHQDFEHGFGDYLSIEFQKVQVPLLVAATLTIEVPIPERQVTITESEFDFACMVAPNAKDRQELLDKIKSKLFKEPAHD